MTFTDDELNQLFNEQPQDDHFGLCPECHRTDGYLNLAPNHWFICHTHKKKWFAGCNLFSSWELESEEDWIANRELLNGYDRVEPYYYPVEYSDSAEPEHLTEEEVPF